MNIHAIYIALVSTALLLGITWPGPAKATRLKNGLSVAAMVTIAGFFGLGYQTMISGGDFQVNSALSAALVSVVAALIAYAVARHDEEQENAIWENLRELHHERRKVTELEAKLLDLQTTERRRIEYERYQLQLQEREEARRAQALLELAALREERLREHREDLEYACNARHDREFSFKHHW